MLVKQRYTRIAGHDPVAVVEELKHARHAHLAVKDLAVGLADDVFTHLAEQVHEASMRHAVTERKVKVVGKALGGGLYK